MSQHYQCSLLYLVKLLIDVDGITDERELRALYLIRETEEISDAVFMAFEDKIRGMTEREVYDAAMSELQLCSSSEKLNVFALLYKMSEVDGRVDIKEIKLLLYAIKSAGVAFDEVVTRAKSTPSLVI
ncbi:hypothetical protein [Pseudochryseolinea flava]|nr:hypothetical protein [Pseudochryseolinea flava]